MVIISDSSSSGEAVEESGCEVTEKRNTDLVAAPEDKPAVQPFSEKIRDLVQKFGFRNKEVIIEEEDPALIQMTTQMSNDKQPPAVPLKKKLTNRFQRNSAISRRYVSHSLVTKNSLKASMKSPRSSVCSSSSLKTPTPTRLLTRASTLLPAQTVTRPKLKK